MRGTERREEAYAEYNALEYRYDILGIKQMLNNSPVFRKYLETASRRKKAHLHDMLKHWEAHGSRKKKKTNKLWSVYLARLCPRLVSCCPTP